MAITSESQIIDTITINSGCGIIEEAATDYTNCSKKIKEAASICTAKALSVEKTTMQPTLESLAEEIGKIEGIIKEYTKEIRSAVQQVETVQREALREYQEQQAAQAANSNY